MPSSRLWFPLGIIGIGVLCAMLVMALVAGCTEVDEGDMRGLAVTDGERLMQQHCGTCHLPVPAGLLDKETWLNSVLPEMAPKVGIGRLWGEYYPKGTDSLESTLSMAEWSAIVNYYESEAPDTLETPQAPISHESALPLFSVQAPQWTPQQAAATIFVGLDPSTRRIYYTDAVTETMYRADESLEASTPVQSGHLGVDLDFVEDAAGTRRRVVTSIGTMRAVDNANGEVRALSPTGNTDRILASALPRPVCALPGDFNRDGRRDWVVCGFGHTRGGLFLLRQTPDQTFEKTVIHGVPGAVDGIVGDFNDDGWLDVMVLFGHSDEGVWLFTNDRNGGFERRNLLRFPPVYGSTNFQLADFNDDGALDILYVSGDNADFSRIPKPYHGIYIYINRGDFQFEQSYFYHLDGATEAIAADYDEDGDLDIAAIAFFAELGQESAKDFVYLEQRDALRFVPHVPTFLYEGRKLNMDAGDFDGDADIDLIVGNYAAEGYLHESRGAADSTAHVPFFVLENELR